MRIASDFIRKNGPEFQALFAGGLPDFLTARRPASIPDGVPVFCYHLAEPEDFRRDLIFLAGNGYRTISADDLLDYLERRRDLPEKCVALTFDDGAVNFYRAAFPLLKEYRQRAVLFISPGLHRPAAGEKAAEARPCTWEELGEMHGSGLVDIQSHTWAHRSLTDWPKPIPPRGISPELFAERTREKLPLEDDLRRARESIEARFGKPVRHLAWPCYIADEEAVRAAISAGYRAFWVGVLPGRPLNRPGQSPRGIVRLSGEFLRRLPGEGRPALAAILGRRYSRAVKTRLDRLRGGSRGPVRARSDAL